MAIRFVLLLLLPLLAACHRTVFESPPSANPGCDPELAGHWISIGDNRGEDGEFEARIEPDCAMRVTEHRAEGPRHAGPTQLSTANVGGQRYIWFDAAWAHRSFEIETTPLDVEGDIYLYAYSLQRGVLRLAAPPHRALAHRVLDRDVPGSVQMHDDDLVVRVSGDVEGVRKTLREYRLFRFGDDSLRFRRAEDPR